MHLTLRNVNEAFRRLVERVHFGGIPTEVLPSRYGEVIVIEEPVTITYTHSTEHVLFNPARDCNPFFHLYEALWMLAGRNDVAPLAYYCSRMPEFSDDGKTFNGAYGYRWRKSWVNDWEGIPIDREFKRLIAYHHAVDQLQILIDHLRRKPESRRAVLQMWTVEDDLLKIDDSPDVCCNTCVYLSVEQGLCGLCKGKHSGPFPDCSYCPDCKGMPHDRPRYLNMTVCNRSNDLTWGLLGSNYVCFSILQEYLAAHLNLDVGKYHHFTNNLHAYTEKWHPEKWLAGHEHSRDYRLGVSTGPPLVRDPAVFDRELPEFVEHFSGKLIPEDLGREWSEPFFAEVAAPLLIAFACYKVKDFHGAFGVVGHCVAEDWRIAAEGWLQRRRERRANAEQKGEEEVLPAAYNQYDPDFAV